MLDTTKKPDESAATESLVRGVSNFPLRLTDRKNNQTKKIDWQLTKDDCRRLLLEYPELNSAYELHVKMDAEGEPSESESSEEVDGMQVDEQANALRRDRLARKQQKQQEAEEQHLKLNKRFWTEFMQKNLKH